MEVAVLGDEDVGDVLCAAEEEVGQDHAVHGLVAHDHDVVGIAAQVEGLLDAPVHAVLEGGIPFPAGVDVVVLVPGAGQEDLRMDPPDFLVAHVLAFSRVDLVKLGQGNQGGVRVPLQDGLGSLDGALQGAGEDKGKVQVLEVLGQGPGLLFAFRGQIGIPADPVLQVELAHPVTDQREVLDPVRDQQVPDPDVVGDVLADSLPEDSVVQGVEDDEVLFFVQGGVDAPVVGDTLSKALVRLLKGQPGKLGQPGFA